MRPEHKRLIPQIARVSLALLIGFLGINSTSVKASLGPNHPPTGGSETQKTPQNGWIGEYCPGRCSPDSKTILISGDTHDPLVVEECPQRIYRAPNMKAKNGVRIGPVPWKTVFTIPLELKKDTCKTK